MQSISRPLQETLMADNHAAPKHDYHLVDPSPWPLFCSATSVVMMVGAVAWMKGVFGLPEGTHWLFFLGLGATVLGMGLWWADVVKEANKGDHTPVVAIGLRYGMVLFIASRDVFTLPRRIWDGINENLDLAMAAVAVLLILFTLLLLMADRALRRRGEG